MPWSLRRLQQTGHLHFLTFSCYRRLPKLATPAARDRFEASLESTRQSYEFNVLGYVVMPEHVHLLVTEPPSQPLSKAIQALKQSVSRQLGNGEPFWQARYYDFNVSQADREASLHAPQPGEARPCQVSRRLAMEQLSFVCDRHSEDRRDIAPQLNRPPQPCQELHRSGRHKTGCPILASLGWGS